MESEGLRQRAIKKAMGELISPVVARWTPAVTPLGCGTSHCYSPKPRGRHEQRRNNVLSAALTLLSCTTIYGSAIESLKSHGDSPDAVTVWHIMMREWSPCRLSLNRMCASHFNGHKGIGLRLSGKSTVLIVSIPTRLKATESHIRHSSVKTTRKMTPTDTNRQAEHRRFRMILFRRC